MRRSRWIPAGALVGVALGVATQTATAHEEYVADEYADRSPAAVFADALTDPAVIGPLLLGGLAVLLAVGGYLRYRPVELDVAAFRHAMAEYRDYVPWLLRISLGIPLIGAGFGGYFISPALEVEFRLLQVALGFLLLFGLGTRVTALCALGTYLLGVVVWPVLLLQLEFVGGLLALALVGSGKPSADHTLQRVASSPGTVYGRFDPVAGSARAFQERVGPYQQYLPTITRLGLGVTFVYLGASQKLLRPGIALAVVDRYDLTAVVPVSPELWVLGAGLAEITLGIALFLGVFTRASAATAIVVFTLTLFALPDDPVLAHVSLFGMASVLLITGGGPYALDNRLRSVPKGYEAPEAPEIAR